MTWFIAAAYAASSVDRSVDASPGVTVSVEVLCGSVRVTGSERTTVRTSGTVPDSEAFSLSASAGRITVDTEERDGEDECVDLLIEVPTATSLDLEGISASFVVTGVAGEVEIETVSGDVTLTGAPRSVEAESVSGAVRVTGAAQRVELGSVSGPVVAEGIGGSVSLESVSGPLTLVGGSPLVHAELETVSGEVTFDGALDPSGRLEAATHSGRMRIRLPADTDATLSQSTFSGRIADVFGKGPELVLGAGRGKIELSTFSGEIEVVHR